MQYQGIMHTQVIKVDDTTLFVRLVIRLVYPGFLTKESRNTNDLDYFELS